jgi:hypothetical protein
MIKGAKLPRNSLPSTEGAGLILSLAGEVFV